jgi:hypothetical protein
MNWLLAIARNLAQLRDDKVLPRLGNLNNNFSQNKSPPGKNIITKK